MPDSKLVRIENRLKNQCEKATTALERFKTIVKALPAECPEPIDYCPAGYCAEACLTFAANAQTAETLLKALPAEPLIWLKGNDNSLTVKPLFALRAEEREEDYLSVKPVITWTPRTIKPETNAARWWCRIGPYSLEILVLGATAEMFQPFEESFHCLGGYYGTVYLPLPDAPSGSDSALTQWRAAGALEQDFNQAQRLELEQVDKMRLFLTELFAKGFVPLTSNYTYLYRRFIENALIWHTGIRAELNIFDNPLPRPKEVHVRVYPDKRDKVNSFYDFSVPQHLGRMLRLRDIPVYYSQS